MAKSNGEETFLVTRDEFETATTELVGNQIDAINVINSLKRAINNQAEQLGLHRFILEKFVPIPHLEAATVEYKAAREAMIAAEKGEDAAKSN